MPWCTVQAPIYKGTCTVHQSPSCVSLKRCFQTGFPFYLRLHNFSISNWHRIYLYILHLFLLSHLEIFCHKYVCTDEDASHINKSNCIHLHLMQGILRGMQMFECSGLLKLWCCCNFISMKLLHKILKENREQKGYSQEYISGQLDVSISTISRWESGDVSMNVDQILKYGGVLGMDEKELFASVAKRLHTEAPPFACIDIQVYDREVYEQVMDLAKHLGPLRMMIQTK